MMKMASGRPAPRYAAVDAVLVMTQRIWKSTSGTSYTLVCTHGPTTIGITMPVAVA